MCILQHLSRGGAAGVSNYIRSFGRGDGISADFGRREGSIVVDIHLLEAE